jgi:hypothetical protein
MDRRDSLKDVAAGLIFVGLGGAFAYAATGYDFGSMLRMGPGFFPIVLGVALVALGFAIVVQGLRGRGDPGGLGVVAWRGLVLILGAIVFFGATVRGLGLAPAVFVTAFVTALGSVENGLVRALTIAAALTVFCALIFNVALGVAVPLVGPWLAG